jgi:hypothetical protein
MHSLMETKQPSRMRRAFEHNMLMGGPPGSGKTLLTQGVPSILPPMSFDESLTVTNIYSVAGQLPGDTPLIRHRPCRAPHHIFSFAGLVGGGKVPGPGEISIAHLTHRPKRATITDEGEHLEGSSVLAVRPLHQRGRIRCVYYGPVPTVGRTGWIA